MPFQLKSRRAPCRSAACWIVLVVNLLAATVSGRGAAPARAQQPSATGEALIERHRCGACHADLPQPGPAAPISPKSPLAVLARLRGTDAATPHPDFRLTEPEALAVALGVASAEERGRGRRELARLRHRHPQATPELGRTFARGLNCGGCHEGLPSQPGAGPVLAAIVGGSRTDWLRDYLRAPYALRPFGARPGSGARMPDLRLDSAAVDTIVSFLRARSLVESPAALPPLPRPVSAHAAGTADALLDRLSCRGCHRFAGRGGRIGPALDDVRTRRTPEYIARVIREPQTVLPGSAMPHTADARVERVIALLAAGSASSRAAGEGAARADVYLSPLDHPLLEAGSRDTPPRYTLSCAPCHGARGDGKGYNAPYLVAVPAPHAAATTMRDRADDTLYDGIATGGASLGRSPEMPAFGATLAAAEIRDLVRYIRALCGCAGPAWSREVRR